MCCVHTSLPRLCGAYALVDHLPPRTTSSPLPSHFQCTASAARQPAVKAIQQLGPAFSPDAPKGGKAWRRGSTCSMNRCCRCGCWRGMQWPVPPCWAKAPGGAVCGRPAGCPLLLRSSVFHVQAGLSRRGAPHVQVWAWGQCVAIPTVAVRRGGVHTCGGGPHCPFTCQQAGKA